MHKGKWWASLQSHDKHTVQLELFPQAVLNLCLLSHIPDWQARHQVSDLFLCHHPSSRGVVTALTRQDLLLWTGLLQMNAKWLGLKLSRIIYDMILHQGTVCGAAIRTSILVQRRLKQTEHPNPQHHLRYTAIGIPPMHMIYGPWILLKSYCRELLTAMSFIWL